MRGEGSWVFATMGAAVVGVVFGGAAVYFGRAPAQPASQALEDVATPDVPPSVPPLHDTLLDARSRVLGVLTEGGSAAGLVVDASGLLVTTVDAIEQERLFGATEVPERVTVVLPAGGRVRGTVLLADEPRNLAVVRIPLDSLPVASFADSSELQLADEVYAWVFARAGFALEVGRVSALGAQHIGVAGLQLGSAPVFDAKGDFVGLVTRDARAMIPADRVRGLLADPQAPPPTIGIGFDERTSPPDALQALGYAVGITVAQVEDPAAQAGIEPGDVIVAVDGRRLDPPRGDRSLLRQLQSVLQPMVAGERLELTVVRDGDVRPVVVTL